MIIPISLYTDFLGSWGVAKLDSPGYRFGQALYNYMKMAKCTQDKEWCDRLYNATDDIAKKMIFEVIDWTN